MKVKSVLLIGVFATSLMLSSCYEDTTELVDCLYGNDCDYEPEESVTVPTADEEAVEDQQDIN
ncbi:hypothetical protein [Pseudozobellia thermophila]|uniref:Lipoprotein n=1 Tax=Pseudozobellia thermophila TaxID=192903 RepID=A0A1M6C1T9_9FLAO|nr:hypothetical protein [Pseudozobellia thermophila]SHI54903.1 hypothetical protein SAMN04488513_101609 [Pseudozobellia thermophila]